MDYYNWPREYVQVQNSPRRVKVHLKEESRKSRAQLPQKKTVLPMSPDRRKSMQSQILIEAKAQELQNAYVRKK